MATSSRQMGGKFVKPPTIQEVRAYCDYLHYRVSPDKFYDHYNRAGWIADGKPINNWQALLDTWERRERKASGKFNFVDQRRRTPEEWLDIERRLLKRSDDIRKARIEKDVKAGRADIYNFKCAGGRFTLNGFIPD